MSVSTEIVRFDNNINNLKQIKQNIKNIVNNDFDEISNEQIEDYADKIKDTFELYKDQIPDTTTTKSTRIDIDDAMVYSKNKLNVFGRTTQTQLSGKNLLNVEENLTFTRYKLIAVNIPAGTYKVTYTSEIHGGANKPGIRFDDNNISGVLYENETIFTLPANETKVYLYSNGTSYAQSAGIDATINQLMISIAGGEYELYCGGQPSPNPDYPQEIENVEGRVCRNKFDGELELGIIAGSTGQNSNDSKHIRTVNYQEVEPETTYKISKENGEGIPMYVYEYREDYTYNLTSGKVVNSTQSFTTEQGTKYVRFRTYSENTNINEKLQLQKGSQVLPYEPYFEGKRLDIVVNNENLAWNGWAEDCVKRVNYAPGAKIEQFDNRNCLMFAPNTGYGEYDTKYLFKTKFKENTRYMFVFDIYNTAGNANLVIHYTDGTKVNFGSVSANTWGKIIYTSAANRTIKYITSAYYSGTKHLDLDTFMVLEGVYTAENLPEYVENKSQTIPFPLQEGQKLMEGDYLADDGIHHTRKQIELSGANTETWYKNTDYSTENMLVANLSANNITDIKSGTNKLKCSHFKYASPTTINSFRAIGNALGFGLDINIFADVNEWKNWLQSNPIIVEYELKEEVVEPYTEAQAEAYNQLMNLMLYKGVNHIWTNTDGLEPNLQLTYKSKSLN